MIDTDSKELSITEQCDLLGKSRSWFYYQKQKDPIQEYQDNLEKKIKKLWKQHVFYGYRQIYNHLDKNMGNETSPKRVYRLMKEMEIKAFIPKRCLSKPGTKHKKYPYLLRTLDITHPNHVWAFDITYAHIPGGIVYVVATIDRYSQKILS
jgi:putative transposase